jgi:CO/xanthine dehydrogenase Mo-binding subunit/CO/xanthine dehydrogenase FAD-binding subunit
MSSGTLLTDTRRESAVGRRVRNIDWEAKTSGSAVFTGDLQPADLLHARIVRGTEPHARIRHLDSAAASAVPGVVAIVTAADFAGARYVHHGGPLADRPVLASDKVRYVGEEIAGVAAETLAAADEAVRQFKVRYEPIGAVTDAESARRPNAPLVHDKAGNLALEVSRRWGAPDARRADASVSGTYTFSRQAHVCMEPSNVVASWDRDRQRLDVWTATQAPYLVRKELAGVLDLPAEQIEMHEVAVGGGFGARSKVCEYEAIACKLSIKSGRPVRLVLTRDEEFAATKSRHSVAVELNTSATASGDLVARRGRITVDNGAYNHSGPSVMGYATLVLGSFYRTDGVEIDGQLVYTNKHPGGQFRGYGSPQATFAIESQMDELAATLDVDPIELRIRNANRPGDVTHTGWKLETARLIECLEAARDAIDWDRKRSWAGSGRGVGLAAAIHVSGAYIFDDANKGTAAIDVHSDGRLVVRHGGADAGTWQKTILAQFAADELSTDVERFAVVMMDSVGTPPDLGAWSSRGTYVGGHAVSAAGRSMRELLRRLAAEALDEEPEHITIADGSASGSAGTTTFASLAARYGDGGVLTVTEEVTLDVEPLDRATGVSNISGAYSFAVQAVEVDVDVETGKVRVVDAVSVHDSGTPINPIGIESQIVGGMAMGLGAALGEDLIYEGGRLVNGSYLSYPLPRAADLPPIRPIVLDSYDHNGPAGAKGVGEIVLVPTAAAVANAVAHATGVRVRDLPITPDRIVAAARRSAPGRHRRSYRLWRRPDRWWISTVRALYPRGLETALHRYGTRLARRRAPQPITAIVTPSTLDEAIERLGPGAVPIGGGTDHLPARQSGLATSATVVDVCVLPELGRLTRGDDGWHLGGAIRLSRLEQDGGDASSERLVCETVRTIASPQIRAMATVAGNLCQQKRCWFFRNDFTCYKRGGVTSPCYAVTGDHRFYHAAVGAHRCQAVTPGDLATTLTALDASVVVHGRRGRRVENIADFFTGPGETTLKPDELIVEVVVPDRPWTHVAFEKLRLWEGDFAVVSAAVALQLDGRSVAAASVCVGAIAPTPLRLTGLERAMTGAPVDLPAARRLLDATWSDIAHPLANNEWKLDAATGVVLAAVRRAVGG